MKKNLQARIFISCGQQKGTDEVEIAHKIVEKLEKMDFEPYLAVEEQTLKGMKENILRRLRESEYFIFVDFKRERLYRLKNGSFEDSGNHRGSLFSHQELAIATFLEIPVLSFREKDVKEEDGILKFIQANCIEFADRHLLPSAIADKVREQNWDANWRNELLLERDDQDFQDVVGAREKPSPTRFYYIKVRNFHHQKIAHDCIAYLESVKNVSTSCVKTFELVEFKWKGLTTSRVAIPPNSHRPLDAFYICKDSPNLVYLGINQFVIDLVK